MCQRITLEHFRAIYKNLQKSEPKKFKNVNDNMMVRKIIGSIVFI